MTYSNKQDTTSNYSARWLMGFITIALISGLLNTASAADDPKTLLKAVSVKMITALNNHRTQIKADPSITQKLIEENLLPHIDFISGSKAVLGNHWDSANIEQKKAFIRAFRDLLLNFYSSALTEYLNTHDGDLNVNLMEFIDPGTITTEQITVRSMVKSTSGKVVPINYEMNKTRKGWKIFDVSVQGVSVITTYKSSYAADIEQKGLDELIKTINSHNKKLKTARNS